MLREPLVTSIPHIYSPLRGNEESNLNELLLIWAEYSIVKEKPKVRNTTGPQLSE